MQLEDLAGVTTLPCGSILGAVRGQGSSPPGLPDPVWPFAQEKQTELCLAFFLALTLHDSVKAG